jgi:hypothetical protein
MTPPQPNFLMQSYRYLRMTLACLLIGLAAAIFWQTWQQDGHLLSSVSAYYYTPAQAIFVSALIGIGGCMIAVEGPTERGDAILSLGGVCAAVVAIVPTSRGADYKAAVHACKQALPTETTPSDPNCPTIQALEAAARANVENNMFALFVIGIAALVVSLIFTSKSKWKFVGTLVALTATWLLLHRFIDSFIDWGHYVAAAGMLLCILVVTVRSALQPDEPNERVGQFPTVSRRKLYLGIAGCMLLVTVAGAALWFTGLITLFWFEILVAATFLVFWTAQTLAPPQRTSSP